MSGEIQLSGFASGKTCYAIITNSSGQFWNGTAFENFTALNWTTYAISLTEQGTSGIYLGTFPSTIAAGVYGVAARQQIGASAAQSDPTVGTETFQWNGTAPAPLSDTATSGQLGQLAPLRLARGVMVKNFPIYLVSSADGVTPFTSGIVSGQISRDGAAFAVLQSGAFTEVGLGIFSLQALTSGDLLCNTGSLVFSAIGISGGNALQRVYTFVTQRTSGQ